jgi:hypothetical protein
MQFMCVNDTSIRNPHREVVMRNLYALSIMSCALMILFVTGAIGNTEEENAYKKPFMGVYTAELTFPKARDLGYDENYGVLITGIVPESPAHYYRLLEADIIMSIGGKEVMDTSHLLRVIGSHRVEEPVEIEVFRDGNAMSLPFTFGERKQETQEFEGKKREKSTGFGGGTVLPMWVVLDMEELNKYISSWGFNEFSDRGFMAIGGGGMGMIGKGFFIGGMGAGGSMKTSTTVSIGDDRVNKRVTFSYSFGGATLTKRVALTPYIIPDITIMAGAGNVDLDILCTDENFSWKNTGKNLDMDPDNNSSHFFAQKMGSTFFAGRVSLGILVRLMSWFGIYATGGYQHSVISEGDFEVSGNEVIGSPRMNLSGYSFSIGPWFGF